MIRLLVPAAELPAWEARGFRLVYLCAGGWRIDGPAAVIEGPPPPAPRTPETNAIGA